MTHPGALVPRRNETLLLDLTRFMPSARIGIGLALHSGARKKTVCVDGWFLSPPQLDVMADPVAAV